MFLSRPRTLANLHPYLFTGNSTHANSIASGVNAESETPQLHDRTQTETPLCPGERGSTGMFAPCSCCQLHLYSCNTEPSLVPAPIDPSSPAASAAVPQASGQSIQHASPGAIGMNAPATRASLGPDRLETLSLTGLSGQLHDLDDEVSVTIRKFFLSKSSFYLLNYAQLLSHLKGSHRRGEKDAATRPVSTSCLVFTG